MHKKSSPAPRTATTPLASVPPVPPEQMAEVLAILTELLLAAARPAGGRAEVRDESEDHR